MIQRALPLLTIGLIVSACGEPSPVVVGHVDTGALRQALTAASHDHDDDERSVSDGREFEVKINGEIRTVRLDDDDVFVIQELPTGDIEIEIDNDRLAGSITIKDVEAAEMIDLSLALSDNEILLRVTRRERLTPERLPDSHGTIEIKGHDVIYHLDARTYHGDIEVKGHNVTLVGPRSHDCDPDLMAVIDGNLKIKGNDVRLIDVLVLGKTEIKGHNVRVNQLCR